MVEKGFFKIFLIVTLRNITINIKINHFKKQNLREKKFVYLSIF